MPARRPPIDSLRTLIREYGSTPAAAGVAAGTLSAAVTLVPMRRWPGVLRAAYLYAVPAAAGVISYQMLRHSVAEQADAAENPGAAPAPSRATLALLSVARAGLLYGAQRFSAWADDALEVGLRRMRVPAPRLVLAAGVGAVVGLQVAHDTSGEQPSPAPDKTPDEIWG